MFRGEMTFLVPPYQRRFVWKTTSGGKQGERLWGDIDELLENEVDKAFLGPIVIDQEERSAFDTPEVSIIDGQQRITCLYTLLWAMLRQAEICNYDDAKALLRRRLSFLKEGGDQEGTMPKLIPAMLDRTTFNQKMREATSFDPPLRLQLDYGGENTDLKKMFNYHGKMVKSRVRHEGGDLNRERMDRLIEVVLRGLTFASIEVPDEYDSNKVFQTLNDQGIALTAADMVRNLIFSKYNRDNMEGASQMFKTGWMPFEESLQEGSLLTDYFYRFGIVKDSETKKGNLFRKLRIMWTNTTPSQIMEDLTEYVPAYRALKLGAANAYHGVDEEAVDFENKFEQITEDLQRLIDIKTPAAMDSYLISLLRDFEEGNCDAEAVKSCIEVIESFLVRRSFCSIEATGLHALFKELWDDELGSTPMHLLQKIHSSPHIKFPEDDDFEMAVRGEGTDFYARKMALYICREYDRYLNGNAGNQMDFVAEPPTKEHIIPNTYREDWDYLGSEGEVLDVEEHAGWKNSWANITLLTLEANGQIGDRDWSEKKPYYTDESLFQTTRQIGNEYDDMGIKQIKERANELVTWALERWPRGGE
jgi:hypothetical protein